jgi:hypothetical protein
MFIEYYNVEETQQVLGQHQRLLILNHSWRRYMFYEVGSFGKVKLVKKKNTNKYSCVKIMKKEELIKSQQVDHISNEYRILSTISHPFIVNVS